MKQLLITIAALVLVGCDSSSKYAGKYYLQEFEGHQKRDMSQVILNENNTLVYKRSSWLVDKANDPSNTLLHDRQGSWKIENDFLIIRINGNSDVDDIEYKLQKKSFGMEALT